MACKIRMGEKEYTQEEFDSIPLVEKLEAILNSPDIERYIELGVAGLSNGAVFTTESAVDPEVQSEYETAIQDAADELTNTLNHAKDIQKKIRDVFGKHMGEEQVEMALIMLDVMANAWAMKNNTIKEAYYLRYEDVQDSGTSDELLARIAQSKQELEDTIIEDVAETTAEEVVEEPIMVESATEESEVESGESGVEENVVETPTEDSVEVEPTEDLTGDPVIDELSEAEISEVLQETYDLLDRLFPESLEDVTPQDLQQVVESDESNTLEDVVSDEPDVVDEVIGELFMLPEDTPPEVSTKINRIKNLVKSVVRGTTKIKDVVRQFGSNIATFVKKIALRVIGRVEDVHNTSGSELQTEFLQSLKEVFDNNPDISSIGSFDEYVKYLEDQYGTDFLSKLFYTGTRVNFDNFDKSFFYSGEGAMAYGAGFYLTPVKSTALGYSRQSVINGVIGEMKAQVKQMSKHPDIVKLEELESKLSVLISEYEDRTTITVNNNDNFAKQILSTIQGIVRVLKNLLDVAGKMKTKSEISRIRGEIEGIMSSDVYKEYEDIFEAADKELAKLFPVLEDLDSKTVVLPVIVNSAGEFLIWEKKASSSLLDMLEAEGVPRATIQNMTEGEIYSYLSRTSFKGLSKPTGNKQSVVRGPEGKVVTEDVMDDTLLSEWFRSKGYVGVKRSTLTNHTYKMTPHIDAVFDQTKGEEQVVVFEDSDTLILGSKPDLSGFASFVGEQSPTIEDEVNSVIDNDGEVLFETRVQVSNETLTEYETIQSEAKANGTFMKAPNGQPTNLTEDQWIQVRSKAFKDWFGDWQNDPQNASKVVDENGEPLVVYHGTDWQFNEFVNKNSRIHGFFFSDKIGIARTYGDRVVSSFLNIRNPYNLDAKGKRYTEDMEAEFKAKYPGEAESSININMDLDDIVDYVKNGKPSNSFIWIDNHLKYDGVFVKNIIDPQLTSSSEEVGNNYVAFNSNQIKSATSNTGAFSRTEHNIYYQQGESAVQRAAVQGVGGNKFILHALTAPDVGSLVHEFMHVAEQDLDDTDLETLETWSGHTRGTVEFKEAVADGMVKFVSEDHPEISAINEVFSKIAKLLKSLYRGLVASPLDLKMDDNVRMVYAKILGAEEAFSRRVNSAENDAFDMSQTDRATFINSRHNSPSLKKYALSQLQSGTKVVLKDGSIGIVGVDDLSGTTAKDRKNGILELLSYPTLKDVGLLLQSKNKSQSSLKNKKKVVPSCT